MNSFPLVADRQTDKHTMTLSNRTEQNRREEKKKEATSDTTTTTTFFSIMAKKRRRTNREQEEENHEKRIETKGRQPDYCPTMKLTVLFKSRDVLIIDKPFDVHIDGHLPVTIEKLVNAQHADMLLPCDDGSNTHEKRKLKFCHQLDYSTSGILCLAFTRDSCSRISTCFQFRTAQKFYLAVVLGHMNMMQCTETATGIEEQIHIKTWIGSEMDDIRGFRMCVVADNEKQQQQQHHSDVKWSETICTVLKRGYYKQRQQKHNNDETGIHIGNPLTHKEIPVTKVLLRPMSGRRHQLRLHMKHIGHPICGDATYANDFLSHRMMLHAWKLIIPVDLNQEEYRRPAKYTRTIMEENEKEKQMTFETNDPFEGDLFRWIDK